MVEIKSEPRLIDQQTTNKTGKISTIQNNPFTNVLKAISTRDQQ